VEGVLPTDSDERQVTMSVPLFVSDRSKPALSVRPLSVGCFIFEQMDQIDFTGPFEVLSRMPDTAVQIIGKDHSRERTGSGAGKLSEKVRADRNCKGGRGDSLCGKRCALTRSK
jgi:hypothetical protein